MIIKKSTRLRLPGEIDEKEQIRKNATELLKRRQLVINAFENGIFSMKTANAVDDVDYHYIYDDELYPKGTLTPKTPATPPVILAYPPPRI